MQLFQAVWAFTITSTHIAAAQRLEDGVGCPSSTAMSLLPVPGGEVVLRRLRREDVLSPSPQIAFSARKPHGIPEMLESFLAKPCLLQRAARRSS